MKYVWLVALTTLVSASSFAQQRCAQHIQEQQLRESNPAIEEALDAFDANMEAMSQSKAGRADLFIIPVVFHVLHQNGEENISDEQIHDAMRIINEDFSATNPDLSEVVSSFENIIGVGDIEFRLARLDPNGNPTDGIDRIQSSETEVGDDGSKLNNWPRDQYLNIWTSNVIGISNAAAYAYRPAAVSNSGSADIDGIMANHRYVGSIGTAGDSPHTLSHEIGHYLGLPHPWGSTNEPEISTNCSIDDGISDTPNTIGTSGGCPLTQETCGSLDNVQNFMDYANCDAMFTEGQVNVMRNVLNSGTADRDELSEASNLVATGVVDLYEANFSVSEPGICLGEVAKLYDASQYDATGWSWSVDGPMSASSTDENPEFNLIPGVYDVSLSVQKDGVERSVEKQAYLVIASDFGEGLPFSEDFEDYERNASVWAIRNLSNNQFTWETYEGSGTLGDRSFRMNNFGNALNSTDELILGALDARSISSMSISFEVAYSQVSTTSDDELSLFLSNDCGMTWRQVWSKSGSQLSVSTANIQSNYSPVAADWETFSVDNIPETWIGESTFLKFTFVNGGGNHLYLDNINIDGNFRDVPQLVFPSNGAANMLSNTVLDWRVVKNVDSYEYELDVTTDFNSSELQSGVMNYLGTASDGADTELPAQDLVPNQQYFWRVRSNSGGVSSDWSEVWSFTVAEEGLGTQENQLARGFVLYPNPAQDFVTLEFTDEPQSTSIEIMDMAGRVLKIQELNASDQRVSISTTELPNGWYVLKATRQGETAFKQFAVSR